MIKSTAGTSDWMIYDSTLVPYNESNRQFLSPNNTLAATTGFNVELLSNGFKINSANGAAGTSANVVYAAFASVPFGGSNVNEAPAALTRLRQHLLHPVLWRL